MVFVWVMMTVMLILFIGCVTNVGIPNVSRWSKEVSNSKKDNYSILGPVKFEKELINVLGIFQRGGVLYADFLVEAQRQYRGTDAIIYVNVERKISSYFAIFSKIEYTMTGIAIRFNTNDRPLVNNENNYNVIQVNGRVQWLSGTIFVNVSIGNVLNKNTIVRIDPGSSLTLKDENSTYIFN